MPAIAGFWWQTMTPLAADTEIAAEKYHILIDEYYRRTTWKLRLYNRLYFAYRAEQHQEADEERQRQQEAQAAMREQMAQYHAGRQ